MKNLFPLLCLTLSLSVNSFTFSQTTQERLIGKWQLIGTSGGITGKGFRIEKNTVIEFTLDCKYKSFEEDSLKYTKTYSLLKDVQKPKRRVSGDILHIGKGFFGKYEMYFREKRLVLREPYPDGFTRVYRRVPPKVLE
jgi:hypothetical protein